MSRVTIDIGSGLGIDEETAEMIVLDQTRIENELQNSNDPCDRAVAAIVAGNVQRAEIELASAPASLRRNALRGEILRVTGQHQQAIATFTRLVDQHQPTGLRRAMLLQHLGKAEHAAGDHRAAIEHLQAARQLRREHDAPADQIASTELMLKIASTAYRRPIAPTTLDDGSRS